MTTTACSLMHPLRAASLVPFTVGNGLRFGETYWYMAACLVEFQPSASLRVDVKEAADGLAKPQRQILHLLTPI